MKAGNNKRKGTIFAAMTDLFMNFALALVWVLFAVPLSGTNSISEQIEAREETPGSKPAAGKLVAKAQIDGRTGAIRIHCKGEEFDLDSFEKKILLGDFPDHFVFQFEHLPDLDKLGTWAIERDSSVSIKMKNRK